MARVIAMMNQQSQVGKTAMTYNIGYALALMHQHVTLIDLAPEGALTQYCQLTGEQGVTQCLQQGASLASVTHTLAPGLNVIPIGLTSEHGDDGRSLQKGYQLKQMIDAMPEQDFIVIDCPTEPSLSMLRALLAADEVVIPTTMRYLSTEGMVKSIRLFKQLKRISHGAKLWLAVTQYESTTAPSKAMMERITAAFPQRVLKTKVQHNTAIQHSQSQQQAIFDYQQTGPAATDFYALAQDLLEGRVH